MADLTKQGHYRTPAHIVQPARAISYPQGQPLEVYRTPNPWSMWGPVLVISLIVSVAAVAIFHLAMTGWVSLAEIGLARSEIELEHARLMAEAESYSQGEVVGYVVAALLGAMVVPGIAITCARR